MDKKFVGLISLLFLSFILFISIVIFDKPLTRFTKAKEEVTASGENSHLFAWPLSLKADGQTVSKITVFVQNSSQSPVSTTTNKVNLKTSLGVIRELPTNDEQNKRGEAVFALTSDSPGIAEVSGTINNSIQISQKISIKFE